MQYIVLPDGETFDTLGGCEVIDVPDEIDGGTEAIEELLGDDQVTVVHTFDGDSAFMTPALAVTIRMALEGDSNDDEHDALYEVAEHFGIEVK
jgi:hypothetical protein